jgi:alginate O-acetyltransferase complex protein AlgI
MLFNSISFSVFLPIVFALYWFLNNKNLRYQNALLLGSSYLFYACWDSRFLFLLIFSTLLDYFTALKISNSHYSKIKKNWFLLSISFNLAFLGFFKYYNFFADSFAEALSHLGLHSSSWTIKIILPIGISFYTFHGLSYIIDVYKGRVKAEKNIIDYALFVSFFPLLVAGPIERATHLLPQIKEKRVFEYDRAVDGLRQILWGFFKKVVIADQCSVYVNIIFDNSLSYLGSTLILGAVLFSFQIYGDFSGYSDIALGTARLLGIDLLRNFAFPYFSRDIAEFWRRWHISLSSWFRDYLYIPLGGSHERLWLKIRNIFILFSISGFWHGANWTFIVWGLLNALYMIPSVLFKKNKNNLDIVAKGRYLPSFRDIISMSFTFILTTFAWIIFRSNDLHQAANYIKKIFSRSLFTTPEFKPYLVFILLSFFIVLEWLGREQQYAIAQFSIKANRYKRWLFYLILVFMIFHFGVFEQKTFIYFQF